MRHAPPLRVGKRCAFVGRLQPTTKLRATWCLRFGPGGRAYEVTCTASRKSRKREVFADGCLVHSGGLGLREHGGGAGGAVRVREEGRVGAARAAAVLADGCLVHVTS